jgi:AcrR family transcriptional regulator
MAINIETQETRIDPRVKRTQKLIREALRALLSEQSFESTSVQDISERATVNRATFYAHFTDKFALLDAIIREDIAARLSEGDPLAAPDVRTMLRTVTKNMFDFVASHSGSRIDRDFELQLERTNESALATFLELRFGACKARVISSAIVGSAMNWRAEGCNPPIDRVIEEIVNVLANGVDGNSR